MSPTPANYGSPWPSPAAAARTEWHIKAATGSDYATGESEATALATWAQLATRLGHLQLRAVTVVYIYGNLGAGDGIVIPAIGDGGSITVRRVAAASTIVATGTLTGVTAPTGNTPATITDTSINFATHVGRRLLTTSGANAGASLFIARNLGSGVAEFARAQALDPAGTIDVTLDVGDSYQLEYMPDAVSIRFPFTISGAAPAGTTTARVILWDLALDEDSSVRMHAPNLGGVDAVAFYGCTMGQIDGTYTAVGCSFPLGMTWSTGEQKLFSCLVRGSPTIGRGASSTWSGDTLVSGGAGAHVAGDLKFTGDVRLGNSSSIGLTVDIGGTVVCSPSAAIRGAGHTGIGLWIMPGARLYYDLATGGLPKITGSGGDLKVSGLQLGYNSILFGQPDAVSIDGAILARYATTAYAIPLATPFTADITMFGIAAGAEVVGCIATLPINGPNFTVPANATGRGFVCKFLQPWTAAGSSFDILVEWWVGTSMYFTVCGVTRSTDGIEGQHFSIGSSSPYTFVAGIGGDLRVRIINNGLTPLPPITIIIWT